MLIIVGGTCVWRSVGKLFWIGFLATVSCKSLFLRSQQGVTRQEESPVQLTATTHGEHAHVQTMSQEEGNYVLTSAADLQQEPIEWVWQSKQLHLSHIFMTS